MPFIGSFSYQWLPLAKLVNVPDINVVMPSIAAALMYNHRKQLIGVVTFLSISLKKWTNMNNYQDRAYEIDNLVQHQGQEG